ncbi:phytanoyl-CoA dioxygenase-like [Nematostella vectensis]|uniref:phytanoyl-CoA dioxygenase-like n=1 Tax=Nematostella vectensis TaxID=45351 RepID=UPI0020770E6A|nr:phytanoyl-CoA dioxygenase-like [Nematostella vectensis]
MPVARESTDPSIYTVPPPQPTKRKPGQLSTEQLKHFFKEGYVVVPKLFTPEELQPVIDAINLQVDELAEDLYANKKIKDKHENAGFYERLTLLEKEFPGVAVLLHKRGILPKAFQDLWTNERLLNAVEQIIGPEISGHPVWNLRTKTPKNAQVTVPWHQDNAYLSSDADDSMTPTAWIPLLDAKRINGCMEVVKGGHRKGAVATHTCCAGPTWYVMLDEEEMESSLGVSIKEDVVLCEVPFGGVLFINNMIPHRSLENFSDKIRWSLDLRWLRPDKPNGFYGLKDNILMRTSKDPNFKPDFESFAKMDRHLLQEKISEEQAKEDRFSTVVAGPWMSNWEIVHHNKHSDAWLAIRDKPNGLSSSWHA